jgi:hypothetical protein
MKRGSREEVVGFRELYDQKEGGRYRYPFSAQDDFFPHFFFLIFFYICSQGFLFSVQASRGMAFSARAL